MPPARRAPRRIGLALAGGGPGGAVYELGALRALEEAIPGLDPTRLDVYVGVSAGSFVAACLANEFTVTQMCRTLERPAPGQPTIDPRAFFVPARREYLRRSTRLPALLVDAIRTYLHDLDGSRLLQAIANVARALPAGIFDNDGIRRYLADLFSQPGRTDDFRELDGRLFVMAVELCTGRLRRFGSGRLDHVPISLAIQASTALPGLYPPVAIDGRDYVDGVLLKTLSASAALNAGVDLLLCINPIVPVNVRGYGRTLLELGLPAVLSQTFRTLIHSRLELGLAACRSRYKRADIVLFEPRRSDHEMFFTNVLSFTDRLAVCELGYRVTRRDLLARQEELEPLLARHGLGLDVDVLEEDRELWAGLASPPPPRSRLLPRLDHALRRAEDLLALN